MPQQSKQPDFIPAEQAPPDFIPAEELPTRKPPPPLQVTPDVAANMFKAGVHSQMLGVSPGVAYENRDAIESTLRERGANYDDGELDPTIANDIKVGLEGSIFGLHHREKLAETVRNPGMIDKFVTGLSEMVADLPWYVAGGLAGGAVGGLAGSEVPVIGNITVGAIGASAGAFAVPAAMREALVLGIKDGEVKDFSDLLRRAAKVTWEGTKGALVGAATELTGGLPVGRIVGKSALGTTAVKGLYQATALTTAADLLEGKLPSADDFSGNAALIIPLNLITHGRTMTHPEGKQALMDVYAKDGKTPQESSVILEAQPPVKTDMPPGLQPSIQHSEGFVEGDPSETHAELAERTLAEKPLTLERLEADPALADDVLQNPAIQEQAVIDRAWELKSEAIDAGDAGPHVISEEEAGEMRYGAYAKQFKGGAPISKEEYLKNLGIKGDFVVADVPLDKVKNFTAKGTASKTAEYSRLTTEAPPIHATLADGGDSLFVRDGNHRVDAAKTRGEDTIKAMVPVKEYETFAEKNGLPKAADEKPLSIDDLYDRSAMKSGRGFTTPDGKFLSRMEARKWVKDNEPEVHEMWQSEQDGDKQAELRSEAYVSARNRVQARTLAQGDAVMAQVSPENASRLAAARVGLNKIKAGLESKGYGKEVLRTLFVGQRDTRIAETTQLRDSLKKIIPDFRDQEALSIYRDYKGDEERLVSDLEEIRAGDNERLKSLIPSIERAVNPTPEMLDADQRLTGYYAWMLEEGRQLGTLDSGIDPANYTPHILNGVVEEGEAPSGLKRSAISKSSQFAKGRKYATIIDALKTEKLDARAINALDALSIRGDSHAVSAATKLLETELKNTDLGKYGTEEDHPEGWTQIGKQRGVEQLYVPKDVADALRPIVEPNVLIDQPGAKALQTMQGFTKSLELGLSIFHMKALSITAMNNMSFADFTRSLASDTKSPEFAEAERGWAADGLRTSKTATPYEAYEGLKESSIKDAFEWRKPSTYPDVRKFPGIKQIDAAAKWLTDETFDVIQRKFKVQDAELKSASWRGKNPEASEEEYFAARRSIAKEVNSAYGGLNWEVMGFGKNYRTLTQAIMLAPDWTFSNIANVKYAMQGGPSGAAARMFWVKSFATGMALTQATSIAISGQGSKHPTQVYLGKDSDGKELYSNWFFAGAPKDAITLVGRVQKDGAFSGVAEFLTGKLGPIAATLMGLSSKTDAIGRPLFKPHDTAVDKTIKGAEFSAGKAIPITVKSVGEMLLDGKQHSLLQYAAAAAGSNTTHDGDKGSSEITNRFSTSRGSNTKRFSIRR